MANVPHPPHSPEDPPPDPVTEVHRPPQQQAGDYGRDREEDQQRAWKRPAANAH